MLIFLKFIAILFILSFNFNMLFVNEEFIIVFSLIIFFSILISKLRLILTKYFSMKIQFIYSHFSYLMHLELLLCDKIFILLTLEETKFLYLSIPEYISNFVSNLNSYFINSSSINKFLFSIKSINALNLMHLLCHNNAHLIVKDFLLLLKPYYYIK